MVAQHKSCLQTNINHQASRDMIYLFWVLAAPTGVLAAILLFMSLAGSRLSAATPIWLSLLAAAGVMGVLVWAYRIASSGGRPLLACGLVLLSWFVFMLVMFANGIAQQKTWQ
jgi:hypothetical protein